MHKTTCTRLLTATLFVIAKKKGNNRHLSVSIYDGKNELTGNDTSTWINSQNRCSMKRVA